MKSRIEELKQLLPPPAAPRCNRGDWSQIEASLGTSLPRDFKDFTETYGNVKLCNYLFVHTPFPFDEGYRDFLLALDGEYDKVVRGRDRVPFRPYPTPGGILGIAGTDNSDVISWITNGPPDEWGIFFWNWPGQDVATFSDLNLTGFLVELVSMKSPLFPNLMPDTFFSSEQRNVMPTE